jgi:hypothetical protein
MGVTLITVITSVRRVLLVAVGLLGGYTLGEIAVSSHGNAGFTYANFFSYFTVLSNVLAVVVLLCTGLVDPPGLGWQYFRGAVTLYMVITGIVYNTLLTKAEVGVRGWENAVVHAVLPLVMLLDWLLAQPPRLVPARPSLGWLAFPLVYAGYSLIRGPIVDWYPYPFIDPRPHGYLQLTITCIVLAAVMAGLAIGVGRLLLLSRRLARRSADPMPSQGLAH